MKTKPNQLNPIARTSHNEVALNHGNIRFPSKNERWPSVMAIFENEMATFRFRPQTATVRFLEAGP